jgi:hypothetical protein
MGQASPRKFSARDAQSLVGAGRFFCRGLSEPGFEPRLAQLCVIVGNECSLAHRNAVVTRVRIVDNLARVIPRDQGSPHEFIQREFLWSAYFYGAIQR